MLMTMDVLSFSFLDFIPKPKICPLEPRARVKMPLISVNLKDPGGLASHSNNVTRSVARSFKNRSFADLAFVCR